MLYNAQEIEEVKTKRVLQAYDYESNFDSFKYFKYPPHQKFSTSRDSLWSTKKFNRAHFNLQACTVSKIFK